MRPPDPEARAAFLEAKGWAEIFHQAGADLDHFIGTIYGGLPDVPELQAMLESILRRAWIAHQQQEAANRAAEENDP